MAFFQGLTNSTLLQGKMHKNSHSKGNAISFGCRIMALMAPKIHNSLEHDVFVRSSLEFLKEESELNRKPRDGFVNCLTIEDLKESPRFGNPDGWGMITYIKDKLIQDKVLRGKKAAYSSRRFDLAIDKVVKDNPDIIMAHIRRASDPDSVRDINNTHPFTYGNWSFIHNGFINIEGTEKLSDKLDMYVEKYDFKIAGTTDTEKAFYYILGCMKDKGIDLDAEDTPVNEVRQAFAEAVSELVTNSKKGIKEFSNAILGLKGSFQTDPACNFVMSNDKMILAYRNHNMLFLGQSMLSNGQSEYIISSETFEKLDKNVVIKWFVIPQDFIISLSKDEKGKTCPEMHPLQYLNNKNKTEEYVVTDKEVME